MEVLILDSDLKAIDIIDTSESLIWTDRYCEYGDFELYEKASVKMLSALQPDYYLWTLNSDHIMIIESRQIKDDAENGNHILISGRSLESILSRRVVWQQTVLRGSLQNGIERLLNENIIAPDDPSRRINNFVFKASTDPFITALTIDAQYTYKDLYETIRDLCSSNGIGFKITMSNDNKFVFELYVGQDRSYDQLINPYVIFSPDFDNLISGHYSESQTKLKNVTIIAGEGEGLDRITAVIGNTAGLLRREMYTDARDISTTVDGVMVPSDEYLAQLAQRGLEDLIENMSEVSFDGQADTNRMFIYGEDFFLGDVVQFMNEYGVEAKARVSEIIMSQNISSIDTYPTFTIL